jgi:hypothetical protein
MLSFGAMEARVTGTPATAPRCDGTRYFREGSMARQLTITYFADRDMLGLVSDEDYEQFKDLLLEALHKEWPKATIAVDDGEHASIEVEFANGDFPSAKAEQDAKSDVESRVHEIAIEEREWATEEEYEGYDEDYDEELEERRGRDEDEDY